LARKTSTQTMDRATTLISLSTTRRRSLSDKTSLKL